MHSIIPRLPEWSVCEEECHYCFFLDLDEYGAKVELNSFRVDSSGESNWMWALFVRPWPTATTPMSGSTIGWSWPPLLDEDDGTNTAKVILSSRSTRTLSDCSHRGTPVELWHIIFIQWVCHRCRSSIRRSVFWRNVPTIQSSNLRETRHVWPWCDCPARGVHALAGLRPMLSSKAHFQGGGEGILRIGYERLL